MPLLTPPTLWDGVFLTWHHHNQNTIPLMEIFHLPFSKDTVIGFISQGVLTEFLSSQILQPNIYSPIHFEICRKWVKMTPSESRDQQTWTCVQRRVVILWSLEHEQNWVNGVSVYPHQRCGTRSLIRSSILLQAANISGKNWKHSCLGKPTHQPLRTIEEWTYLLTYLLNISVLKIYNMQLIGFGRCTLGRPVINELCMNKRCFSNWN